MPKSQLRTTSQDGTKIAHAGGDWRGRKRRRAPPEVYEWFKNVFDANPNASIRDLVKVAHTYGPDAQFMTYKSVSNMFEKKRKRGCSLSSAELRTRIQELLHTNPDPSFRMVCSWAISLGAAQATVFREVARAQDELIQQGALAASPEKAGHPRTLSGPPVAAACADGHLLASDGGHRREIPMSVSGQERWTDITIDAIEAEGGAAGPYLLEHWRGADPIVQPPSSFQYAWGAHNAQTEDYVPLPDSIGSAWWPTITGDFDPPPTASGCQLNPDPAHLPTWTKYH
ncbi:hypothetical protein CERSUDRAFT_98809 [Gelatoporia subvermispora B]|uniref:Uncharacterized protein n=1 Tax=Ceriporiopsis subvermispora (strain B) TaxID=914234 RepID=M2R2U2_CERS8|nr:hypothetical protein CERSUDRAFT_98809 [Gelatoporia subvermispora B]